ncbi:MAG: GIY-YIG nuclease family protein [Desulfovibrio sp.]|nr:GIY-YIG nuclease family protein [Desulfovibrio sp.]MBI4961308.1 GIY-YIG nuclease family protein [Desulfovibrio sp.]
MNWTVYLLTCADSTLYCGITRDVARRLDEHNGLIPGGARYTRSRRPVELVGSKLVADRSEALKLERTIKRMKRAQKLAFFQNATPEPASENS